MRIPQQASCSFLGLCRLGLGLCLLGSAVFAGGSPENVVLIVDPTNPGNKVLRMVATGTTDHQSDHGETTLVGDQAVVLNPLTEYEVSFRAK